MPAAPTTVYFDGSCPLCRREISVYRKSEPSSPIDWVDVSTGEVCTIDGGNCGDLMQRFHLRTAEGEMLSGAAAFVALWQLFPGWRWLGRFGALPGMRSVLELLYRAFLRVRPRLQGLARRYDRAAS